MWHEKLVEINDMLATLATNRKQFQSLMAQNAQIRRELCDIAQNSQAWPHKSLTPVDFPLTTEDA